MTTRYLPPIPHNTAGNLLDIPGNPSFEEIHFFCGEFAPDDTRATLDEVFNLAIIHDTFNDPRRREQLLFFKEKLEKAIKECYQLSKTSHPVELNLPPTYA